MLLRGLLLAALLTTVAGCTEPQAKFSSFEDALASPGIDVTDGNITVRILEPVESHVHTGITPVWLLVYDANQQPIEDAVIVLDAFMPSMGHGTNDELDPTHQYFGVYEGQTDLFMPGEWTLRLSVTTADYAPVFEVPFDVAATSSDHTH